MTATPDTLPVEAPAKPRRSSRVKDVAFKPTEGVPLAQAAALALGIMRHMRVSTWAEVQHVADDPLARDVEETQRALLAGIALTDEQQALLNRYAAFLPYLRLSPTVTLAICPVCFVIDADPAQDPSQADPGEAAAAEAETDPQEPVEPLSPVRAHGWSVVARAVPTKCRLTPGCDAKPIKVAAATKA